MNAHEIAEKYYGALCEGRFADAQAFVSPDHIYRISGEGSWAFGGAHNKEKMAAISGSIYARFPAGINLTVKWIIGEGDRAVVLLDNNSVRSDGRVYHNALLMALKLKDGLIVETLEFLDTIHANDLLAAPMG